MVYQYVLLQHGLKLTGKLYKFDFEEKYSFSFYYSRTSMLEYLWDYKNLFETGVIRVIEGLLQNQVRGHNRVIFDFLQHEGI